MILSARRMKRKKFLIISALAVTAISVPVAIKYSHRRKVRNKPLEQPKILGNFCNENDIQEIGIDYRKQNPGECQKQQLVELLLKDDTGKKISPANNAEVSDWLDQKTLQEFKSDNTIVVAGWVISVTEARQCALFSLT